MPETLIQSMVEVYAPRRVAAAQVVPRIHDLEYPSVLAAAHFPLMAEAIEGVAQFTPWGTATRYPELESGMGIMPSDIHEALAAIDTLRAAVMAAAPPCP